MSSISTSISGTSATWDALIARSSAPIILPWPWSKSYGSWRRKPGSKSRRRPSFQGRGKSSKDLRQINSVARMPTDPTTFGKGGKSAFLDLVLHCSSALNSTWNQVLQQVFYAALQNRQVRRSVVERNRRRCRDVRAGAGFPLARGLQRPQGALRTLACGRRNLAAGLSHGGCGARRGLLQPDPGHQGEPPDPQPLRSGRPVASGE